MKPEEQKQPSGPEMPEVIEPEGKKGGAYLANNNYLALLKWNRSHHFAIAAGTLSDRIAAQ